jgi:hypothetical protein
MDPFGYPQTVQIMAVPILEAGKDATHCHEIFVAMRGVF